MMNLKSLPLLFLAVFAQSALATVQLDIQTGVLRTSSGTIIPTNTTLILVSDTNGFSSTGTLSQELLGVSLTAGTTFGNGSKILSVIGASDLSGSGDIGYNANQVFDLAALGLTGGAGTTGTDLAILWFPGLTGTGAATLANGQSFGYYRSDVVDSGSGGTWTFNMPADSTSQSIYALDSNLGGGIAPSTFNAAYTVSGVPEPSRILLAGLGLVGLVMRRRRSV